MHFDTIVVGSGAGTKIAQHSSQLGFKTALIEQGPFGGTCVNRGCIPSKLLIHPADLSNEIKRAEALNIKASMKWDYSGLIKRVKNYPATTSKKIEEELEGFPNLTLFKEKARFVNDSTLQVGGHSITGDKIYLAIGGRPLIPSIEGLENYLTSDDMFSLKELPKRILIIGGGFIAAEMSHHLAAHGVEVTILTRSQYLSKADITVQKAAKDAALKRLKLIENCTIERAEGTTLHTNKGDFTGDAILVAAGLQPNTDDLGLESTSIQVDKKGFIRVDTYLRTDAPHIYAMGDCLPYPHFRHTANFQGDYLKQTLGTQSADKGLAYPCLPYAIFTEPHIGAAGPTKQELEQASIPHYSGSSDFTDGALAKIYGLETGQVTLYFHGKTDQLLGAHITGKDATTIIHVLIAYIQKKATRQDIIETIFIHPTLAELIRSADKASVFL